MGKEGQSRFAPLADEEMDAAQEAMAAPLRATGPVYNVSRSWLRHTRSLKAFNGLAAHVFNPASNTLPVREREVLVLRAAWRCRSEYEWGRHLPIAREAGLSDAEIEACKRPLAAHDWSETEATLMEAADALLDDFFIPDRIWLKLTGFYEEQQCIDVVMSVGMYMLMGMYLNAGTVPLDEGFTRDPDIALKA